jgi:AcrR family transcriptional regulator
MLANRDGIGGLTLRGLAREVGIRQPSLYEYFESKHALYDAMFAVANEQLLARLDALRLPVDPRRALQRSLRAFIDFALENNARRMLLFERPIPGFEPSATSYAFAEQALDRVVQRALAAGLTDPGDIDCLVAMVGGLIAAQASNDPGGDRWTRHLDHLLDMHLDHARTRSAR